MRIGGYSRGTAVAAVVLVGSCLIPGQPAVAAAAHMPGATAVATAGRPVAAPDDIECGQARSDALDHKPWPLHRLRPELAWPLSTGLGVIVAVIDSGISGTHPKLKGQLLPGMDFVPPGTQACDNTHGTLVAAIIAATTAVNPTFYGVAPDAKILPVRVLPDAGVSTDPDMPRRIGDAIRWSVDHGARVINLSLYTEPTQYLADSVAYAIDHDVVVVAAAGNVGAGTNAGKPVYPASYDHVIAVAGVDENDRHVSSSVAGPWVAVSAPGVSIEGPAPRGNGYGLDDKGGTSFAAAYVSGVAALIRARSPKDTVDEVARRIILTADPPPDGNDQEVGHGVVNPFRALTTFLDKQTTVDLSGSTPVKPQRPPKDPLASAKRVAAWVAPCGILLAVLLLLARPVVRRGRERGWRPADTSRWGPTVPERPDPRR